MTANLQRGRVPFAVLSRPGHLRLKESVLCMGDKLEAVPVSCGVLATFPIRVVRRICSG